ncbi:DUF4221 domain-containing protein [Flavobacteriaceae bacterium Ap0902]|nr:DUF4221 domain-containing protein [Flavobacteriaceae bacterium Ap0902]
MNFKLSIFIFISIALHACTSKVSINGSKQVPDSITIESSNVLYDFTDAAMFPLESALEEVSGLAYDDNEKVLLTHNDEKGIIFKINPENGQTLETIQFGKKGDYEGIAKMNDQFVIVNSSGHLFFYNPQTDKTRKVKTGLTTKNDIEGLAFDAPSNRLLLAAKERTIDYDKHRKVKAIYALDIETEKLEPKPFLEITKDVLINQLNNQLDDITISDKEKKELRKRIKAFAPSGIEIQPTNGDIYIVSAKGSLVVIFNSQKEIKNILFLDKKLFPQAEGITFDAHHLYISTEMKGKGGRLFKFKLKS